MHHSQGNYEEAEPLYKQALVVREKVLGLEHPDLVVLLENYAVLLRELARAAEAENLKIQAEAISKNAEAN